MLTSNIDSETVFSDQKIEDLVVLRAIAERVKKILLNVDGVTEVETEVIAYIRVVSTKEKPREPVYRAELLCYQEFPGVSFDFHVRQPEMRGPHDR